MMSFSLLVGAQNLTHNIARLEYRWGITDTNVTNIGKGHVHSSPKEVHIDLPQFSR